VPTNSNKSGAIKGDGTEKKEAALIEPALGSLLRVLSTDS